MKKLAFISLLLLCSCSHKKPSFDQTSFNQDSPKHYFSEITSRLQDKCTEPQMQWIYYEGKLKSYLNIFLGSFADKENILVKIKTQTGSIKFKANVLKGGQKIKIPDEMIPQIIQLFEKSSEAIVQVGRYETKLNLAQFNRMLNKSKKRDPLSKFRSFMIFDL